MEIDFENSNSRARTGCEGSNRHVKTGYERRRKQPNSKSNRHVNQSREDRLREEVERAKQHARQEVERAKPHAASEAVSTEQLEALQVRLQASHTTAKLLTEEELGNLEDTIADCIEVLPTADVKDAVEQTLRMLLLSERMQVDWFGTFAAAAAQVCVSHEVGFGKEQAAEGSQECKECSGCAWAVVLNTSGFIVDV